MIKLSTEYVDKHFFKKVKFFIISSLIWCLFFAMFNGFAKDFGVLQNTFVIAEENAITYITKSFASLSKDQKDVLKQKMIKTAKKRVTNMPGIDLPNAIKNKRKIYHPNMGFSLKEDISHDGKVLVKKGVYKNNDFEHYNLTSLLFIDGTNAKHISLAMKFDGYIMLTKGNIFEVKKQTKNKVYFDQYGVISKKLGIERLPCMVVKNKNSLVLEEIAL